MLPQKENAKSKKRFRKVILLGIILGAFAATVYVVSEPQTRQSTRYGPTFGLQAPIPYKNLSMQSTAPFLFLGKVVDAGHPRFSQFEMAIKKYPDVRSCLVPTERKKNVPNILLIDWQRIGDPRALNVCLFRIFASLDDLENIKMWLQLHDFRVGKLFRRFSENYVSRDPTEVIFRLVGSWTPEQKRTRRPSWWYDWFGIEFMNSYGYIIGFSADMKITGVASSGSTKLN